MNAIDRLYKANNYTISKSINIDDSLYKEIIKLSKKTFSASISEIINVAIENYIVKNSPKYYKKPELESVTYRTIMMRIKNYNELKKMSDKTGISFTRLLNDSLKDLIEEIK